MNSRATMLTSIRAAARQPAALPEVPHFEQYHPLSLDRFKTALELIGGRWQSPATERDPIESFIRRLFPAGTRFCSVVPEFSSDLSLAEIQRPSELAAVEVGVVRARFGVAETGSLWLSESELQINALGYLPQHLVALLDPRDLVANLHQAYAREDFRQARYCVLMSGPSATADIEGVLIRGAQGVRSLTVVCCARPD